MTYCQPPNGETANVQPPTPNLSTPKGQTSNLEFAFLGVQRLAVESWQLGVDRVGSWTFGSWALTERR
jgi:hypothetical protein